MKKNRLIIAYTLFALLTFIQANAQMEATWVLPQIEIPLTNGRDTLAVLKPRFSANAADLLVGSTVYHLKLRAAGYRCVISRADNRSEVALAKRLGQRAGTLSFLDGKSYEIVRTGKRGNYVYRWQDGSIKIENGSITATASTEPSSLLTQGTLVFGYLQRQYEREKSVNTEFVPIVVSQ